jgi:hypothetical protein
VNPDKEQLAQALREYPTWGDAYLAEKKKNAELKKLLAELLAFEFPRQSWKMHPSPKGKVLWQRVEQALYGGNWE